jgi:hypothetical protein
LPSLSARRVGPIKPVCRASRSAGMAKPRFAVTGWLSRSVDIERGSFRMPGAAVILRGSPRGKRPVCLLTLPPASGVMVEPPPGPTTAEALHAIDTTRRALAL